MTILVCYAKNRKNEASSVSMKLKAIGLNPILDKPIESLIETDTISSCEDISSMGIDMVVSVGGDGTILRASQRALALDKPIFGINAGRVGFLTAFEIDELDKLTMSDISTLNLAERMILEMKIEQKPDRSYLAVNDVVICRDTISKTVDLKVYSDTQLIGEYRGDGVIVSTPTGSTGYSLSAGGPIVDPLLDILLVTPICAHTMFVRSIALDAKKTIRIDRTDRSDTGVYISLDSTHMVELKENYSLVISKSNKTLKLLSSEKKDYFEVLNRRIGIGF